MRRFPGYISTWKHPYCMHRRFCAFPSSFMSVLTAVTVSESIDESRLRKERRAAGRPSHWVNDKHTKFQNPWPSFQPGSLKETLRVSFLSLRSIHSERRNDNQLAMDIPFAPSPTPSDIASIPVRKTEWTDQNPDKLKATWLGHACFLIEFPLPKDSQQTRGARVLFDPAFSDRCSPVPVGLKRFTRKPCLLRSGFLQPDTGCSHTMLPYRVTRSRCYSDQSQPL